MKQIVCISTFLIVIFVSIVGVTFSYDYKENESVLFNLIGPYEVVLELDEEYYEYGVFVTSNGMDISNEVNINYLSLDTNIVGDYKVKYEVFVNGNIEYIYRKVRVIERVLPEIKLLGGDIIYMNLGDTYMEPGYIVSDNYDVDLDDKVVINSNLDVDKIGEYIIEYSVFDSSGNKDVAQRKVIVK